MEQTKNTLTPVDPHIDVENDAVRVRLYGSKRWTWEEWDEAWNRWGADVRGRLETSGVTGWSSVSDAPVPAGSEIAIEWADGEPVVAVAGASWWTGGDWAAAWWGWWIWLRDWNRGGARS